MPAVFRFQAKRVLLTYSQVSERMTKEVVFHTLMDRYPIQYFLIGEETHEDGGRHIHAVMEFKVKVNSRDVGLFDINDGEEVFHPNIKPISRGQVHWKRALDYCQKEDPEPLSNIVEKLSYGEILDQASSCDEFMRLVKEHYPRDYALHNSRLLEMAKREWPETTVNTLTTSDTVTWITLPDALMNFEPLPMRSIVVIGPAGCGKTSWAKFIAPKPCLFVRHLDSLSMLNASHQSIIFDDLTFNHLPPSTQKFLVDMENLAEIHIRYRVARIPAGILRIITSNDDPFTHDYMHRPAIERRCTFIQIN
nr:Rep [Lactuca sativa CRESS virus]